MRLRVSEIADMLGLIPPADDGVASGYSIDSRTLQPGDLFLAIRGPRFDGHDFVKAAFQAGAVAAVVEEGWAAANPAARKLIIVEDTVATLAALARQSRRRWGGPVAAVTGSNGKTTTKNAAAALLATRYRVAKTEGNLNNELGLPLSILRMDESSEIAVFEMGMNHGGEIRRLAAIAEPNAGIVTNVSVAHLGYFSSVEEIALAKRELVESLPQDGVAILNADDERVAAFARVHRGRSLTFGLERPADFRAVELESLGARGTSFTVAWTGEGSEAGGHGGPPLQGFGGGRARFQSPLIGRHNVSNVLAAIAVCAAFGVDPASLVETVGGLRAAALRGEVQQLGGVTLLKDCYNANPGAVEAMIDTLGETPGTRRIAVLGEMLELGDESVPLHRRVGRKVAAARVDLLVAVQGDAREILDAAIAHGFPAGAASFFETAAEAGEFLSENLTAGDTVLLKASRGVGLEKALPAIERRTVAS
jgi:UDP-N-acetylmuramoyl-tripeptide--D-alanyl-D-alanine ligase